MYFVGARHRSKRLTSLSLITILSCVFLTPHFPATKRSRRRSDKAAVCPAGGGIRAGVSHSRAVAPEAPLDRQRAPRLLAAGSTRTRSVARSAPGSRGARSRCGRSPALAPRPAPLAWCRAPRSGRAAAQPPPEPGKRSGGEEEPAHRAGGARERGGVFPGPRSLGLPWRLERVTGIRLRPPWATS